MERLLLEKQTRKIYHKIHKIQGSDHKIFDRLCSLFTTDYLEVEKDFFVNKICLDAGCGSNANATFSMLKMGAKKVYAFDLDKSVFETAPKILSEFKGRYELSVGNVLNMSYPDKFFDFTHCSGVLHSTTDAFLGLRELTRVTKVGGILYISINGTGGLMRDITNFLRDKYIKDKQFKKLIDNLKKDYLIEMYEWIVKTMREQGDRLHNILPPRLIKEFFDTDLILTIKDRIQTPLYKEFTECQIVRWLRSNGFTEIKRLSRYPK